MAILRTLLALGVSDRTIWMYDTFEGMSAPTPRDVDFMGNGAGELLASQQRDDPQSIWCYSTLDEVRQSVTSCGYPESRLRFVPGPVETTLQSANVPGDVALLRLDTDWYESTRIELEVLFPRLADRGVQGFPAAQSKTAGPLRNRRFVHSSVSPDLSASRGAPRGGACRGRRAP